MARSEEKKESSQISPAPYTVGALARLVEGRLEGDPDVPIRGIAPVDQAEPEELAFLAQRRYLKYVSASRARAALVSEALAGEAKAFSARIVAKDAHAALPVLLETFFPIRTRPAEIHPTAVFGKGVDLGEGVSVGPYSVIGEGTRIGDGVRIDAHVVVGEGCILGRDSRIFPQVVLYPGTELGERVILHAGVRLGSDGYGYVTVEGVHRKVPQVGGCRVEDDVEIGANTCIDRGSIGRTVIGKGSKLDNLVQIGHNVRVGEGALIVAQAGVAGSTRLGNRSVLGGQAGISGHLEIGEGAVVAAQGGVIGDIPPGEVVSGYPARSHRGYLKAMSTVFKLPSILQRLKAVEEKLAALEEGTEG